MSFVLAFLGFAALIILHELGHFAAAKAVGMRVERFSLFFPPLIARRRVGETEYAVGALPLGGYVKITGMNPAEELPPEVAHRAYYRQPVWKRIVVIAAGPAVNIVLAFLILWVIVAANGVGTGRVAVDVVDRGAPAAGVLERGDVVLRVDGVTEPARFAEQIASHECAGTPRDGCRAATPASVLVQRDGERRTFEITPVYDTGVNPPRTRMGVTFAGERRDVGVLAAGGQSVEEMWRFTTATVSTIVQIFDPQKREELSGVVGSYEVTRQAFEFSAMQALYLLGVISLSLGVINLFPFLPLDGGHIFWAVAEKVRGRAIPFSVMERAGFIGFALVIGLFMIGLSNDIERLTGEGFQLR